MTREDKIARRYYVKGTLELVSPLAIGSGRDETTDKDIVKDARGAPFIPGSTIAGVLKADLAACLAGSGTGRGGLVNHLFGEAGPGTHVISPIIIHDVFLAGGEAVVERRDGVELDHVSRTAMDKKKYDYQVIEPGATFTFRSELIVREKDCNRMVEIEGLLRTLIERLESGSVAFGGKVHRGTGIVKLKDAGILRLDMGKKDDVQAWIDFSWDEFTGNLAPRDLGSIELGVGRKQATIHFEFTAPASIIVRSPNPDTRGPDAKMLTSGGEPTIPGTSWAGVLKSAATWIGMELQKRYAVSALVDSLFGKGDGKRGREPGAITPSRAWIHDTILSDGKAIPYTRNKIDRFTGGVVDGALFTEEPVFGAKGTLKIVVDDPRDEDIGLLLLAIKDVWHGIQPVGGGASVGRGIIEGRRIKIDMPGTEIDSTEIELTGENFSRFTKALAGSIMQEPAAARRG